jgi:hypothetical protein
MSAPPRPDVRRRFQAVVRRGLARADRERAAELARLRPAPRQTVEARRRLHRQLTDPGAPARRQRAAALVGDVDAR